MNGDDDKRDDARDDDQEQPAGQRQGGEVQEAVRGITAGGGQTPREPIPLVRWAVRGAAGIIRYLVLFLRENPHLPSDDYDLVKELHEQLGKALEGTKRGKRG